MKQRLSLLLALFVILAAAGCGTDAEIPAASAPTDAATAAATATPAAAAPTATPTPTEIPTPSPTPEPESQPGIVRADRVGVLFQRLARGYAVECIGERDGYYIVLLERAEVLVETRFVRLAGEAAYESFTAYAKGKAQVYANAYLEGEPLAALRSGTKLTVLDAPGNTFLIVCGDTQGYVAQSSISKSRGSSGGGSGDSGGGSSGGGSSGGADGGDIQLHAAPRQGNAFVRLARIYTSGNDETPAVLPATFPCAGTVIADETEAYWLLYGRGDVVKIVGTEDAAYQILTEAGIGTVPRRLIRPLSEAGYTEWDGFSDHRASFCEDYRLQTELKQLPRNTAVRVLDDLDVCLLVSVDDTIGYMSKKLVSDRKFRVPSGGGGSSGGGDSGSGGGGPEWTDPVM